MNCDYQPVGKLFTCSVCGDTRDRVYRRVCHADRTAPDSRPLQVGDCAKFIIRRDYGIEPCGGCHRTAVRMNGLGVDGCREHLEELAEELQSNATEMNWATLLKAASVSRIGTQVIGAVKAATKGLALYEEIILEACDMAEASTRKG